MTIDKNLEGAWRICENINGYFETKVYYFYTKKEAIKLLINGFLIEVLENITNSELKNFLEKKLEGQINGH